MLGVIVVSAKPRLSLMPPARRIARGRVEMMRFIPSIGSTCSDPAGEVPPVDAYPPKEAVWRPPRTATCRWDGTLPRREGWLYMRRGVGPLACWVEYYGVIDTPYVLALHPHEGPVVELVLRACQVQYADQSPRRWSRAANLNHFLLTAAGATRRFACAGFADCWRWVATLRRLGDPVLWAAAPVPTPPPTPPAQPPLVLPRPRSLTLPANLVHPPQQHTPLKGLRITPLPLSPTFAATSSPRADSLVCAADEASRAVDTIRRNSGMLKK